MTNTIRFLAFIKERYRIWELKERGAAKPWTQDPILQQYRFCNVYREYDKTTQWIAMHWRQPYATDPDLWFAMLVARKINWPDSLKEIGYPVPWNSTKFVSALARRAKRGEQIEGGAYMITAGIGSDWIGVPKRVFLAQAVLGPAWRLRKHYRPTSEDTLERFHSRLQGIHTVSSFIAGQVVADLKYVGVLRDAPDWWGWACPGPGSIRGMNRITGRDIKTRWETDFWQDHVRQLMNEVNDYICKYDMPRMHAQDVQNCLCEFDKYERVRLGEGRPRAHYPGVK